MLGGVRPGLEAGLDALSDRTQQSSWGDWALEQQVIAMLMYRVPRGWGEDLWALLNFCVQPHSKVNSSWAFLPSGSLCQLRFCWGTQLLHLCRHTNTVCSLSTLSHIKNPIALRFWLHWSRWRSVQILTSRPKIYCERASRTIGSFCKALPFDFVEKSAGILFLIQLSLAWTWHWALFWCCCFMMLRTNKEGVPCMG